MVNNAELTWLGAKFCFPVQTSLSILDYSLDWIYLFDLACVLDLIFASSPDLDYSDCLPVTIFSVSPFCCHYLHVFSRFFVILTIATNKLHIEPNSQASSSHKTLPIMDPDSQTTSGSMLPSDHAFFTSLIIAQTHLANGGASQVLANSPVAVLLRATLHS